MRGADRQPNVPRPAHPLGNAAARGAAASAPPSAERTAPPPAASAPDRITLAQFLKVMNLVETGGNAKHLVRSGAVTVNDQPEDRPGRKLQIGDRVAVDGQEFAVDR